MFRELLYGGDIERTVVGSQPIRLRHDSLISWIPEQLPEGHIPLWLRRCYRCSVA